MTYLEFLPSQHLQAFVKCYFLFESDAQTEFEDSVFPGGHMEIIFNLGDSIWQSAREDKFHTTPKIELWGQLTTALRVRTKGRNAMLGIRFQAHAASLILREDILAFNNKISSLEDVLGNSVKQIHQQLSEASSTHERIELLEEFLIARLKLNAHTASKANQLANRIIAEMNSINFSGSVETLAVRYGITPRYLQKLFLRYTGLTPKLYFQIHRFQQSLKHLSSDHTSLTSVAYECGYFDQSHFIREFKSFTGILPSAYSPGASPLNAALVG